MVPDRHGALAAWGNALGGSLGLRARATGGAPGDAVGVTRRWVSDAGDAVSDVAHHRAVARREKGEALPRRRVL